MKIRHNIQNSLAPFGMGVILFASSAFGAAVKPVGGRVTNDGGKPLEGVTVTLLSSDDSAGQTPLQSAKTDAEGHYRFDGAELNGAYRVQAAKEGFLGKRAA
ncbi:MAG: carboxypeptidase-like regulatory domain-containing protein, partial [Candidatus Sumerlaeota bacterium]|nr:carboxypeptidase-like regulatory domain-containing protein [Candidatus Sumerlaeota bacterium]